jgi:hypothetical protein
MAYHPKDKIGRPLFLLRSVQEAIEDRSGLGPPRLELAENLGGDESGRCWSGARHAIL